MTKWKDILWGKDDEECLTHETAKEAALDIADVYGLGADDLVEVFEYSRMPINKKTMHKAIETVIEETMDEEYSGEDGFDGVRNEVSIAIDMLVDTICREHKSYWMVKTGKSEARRVREWEAAE